MAEYIERNELLENLNRFAPEHYNALINMLITKQPTADVVEVVRCKDCVHYKHFGRTSLGNIKAGWCWRRVRFNEEYRMLPDDFCSHGERRDT